MASLTPLSKGLIALAVVGAMASAAWHLGLKERFGGAPAAQSQPSPQQPSTSSSPPSSSQPPEAGAAVPSATPPDTTPGAGMGSPGPSASPAAQAPDQPAPPPVQAPVPAPVPEPEPAPQPQRKPAPASLSPAEHAERGRQLLERKDYAQARTHLEQAVQGGDGSAACHLGDMNLKGLGGLPANRDKAASLYQLAQSRSIICFASGS
ncbi:MAG: hypothetical protein JWR60_2241 [Polaromonas sp.]|nr:hypothetical protein [Polaromonas sp.]